MVKETLLSSQSGFRKKVRARDALFSMTKILKRVKKENDTFVTFIDFSKTFDSTVKDWLFFSLREHNIPPKVMQIITKFYQNAHIRVKLNNFREVTCSESISILHGVLHGNIFSPTLFSVANCQT